MKDDDFARNMEPELVRASSSERDDDVSADALLLTLVRSDDTDKQDSALSALLTAHADPIVTKIVRYRTRGAHDDAQEIKADVMLQLVGRLQRLRADSGETEIGNFSSYVAVATYNACDRHLSRKYPNRRRLKNGLRYLLSNREGFAVWQNGDGYFVGGHRRWQFNHSEPLTPKAAELQNDVHAFARSVDSKPAWNDKKGAYELLGAIFDWAEGPVDLNLLTAVCAEFWNIRDETLAIDEHRSPGDEAGQGLQIADSRPDASTLAERRDHLQRLWHEITELPPRQRAAVLLNLRDESGRGVIDLWIVVGVATTSAIADALEITAERLSELWNELPLDDNRIAQILGLRRQQVINLRKSARERLERRLKGC